MKRRPVLAALVSIGLSGCSELWPDASKQDANESTTKRDSDDQYPGFSGETSVTQTSTRTATEREDRTTGKRFPIDDTNTESTKTSTTQTTTDASSRESDGESDRGNGQKPESGASGETGAGIDK
jgi:hypothetical protein